MKQTKVTGRSRRKRRIRKKVSGTPDRPRLSVFRSSRHLYAQVIDDAAGRTLVASSTRKVQPDGSKVDGAKAVGAAVAAECLEKGVKQVVLDRGGYLYHGRVKALADAAREAGLDF